jgi:hypothetical protein
VSRVHVPSSVASGVERLSESVRAREAVSEPRLCPCLWRSLSSPFPSLQSLPSRALFPPADLLQSGARISFWSMVVHARTTLLYSM